ncbi:DUF397 domain-containing protein [Streptomyces sp. SGAir0957]
MATGWFKSSYSAADNECVEVVRVRAGVGVRDSKNPGGDVLVLSARSFSAFIDGLDQPS